MFVPGIPLKITEEVVNGAIFSFFTGRNHVFLKQLTVFRMSYTTKVGINLSYFKESC